MFFYSSAKIISYTEQEENMQTRWRRRLTKVKFNVRTPESFEQTGTQKFLIQRVNTGAPCYLPE